MTSEWEIVSLGDYCEIKNGYAFKSKDFSTSGVPVIKIKNVKPNQIVESDFSYIPEDIALEKDKWIIRKGDILLTMTGNRADGSPESWVGKAAIFTLDGKYLLNQRVASIRSKSIELDTEYLGYFLSSWESQLYFIKHSNSSGGQANISPDIVRQYLIPLPPLAVQKRMVSVLKVIDEMISANQQINDNLQQQAQALYKHYFPYSVGDELPDGWRIGSVGEIIEIHDSKRVPLSGAERAKMEKKTYPYYGAAALMDYVDDYIFDGKYLLLGEDGTVVDNAGYPILQYVWGQFWVNNHAHILTGKLGFNVESLYMLFKQTPVKAIVTGAVQPKISQANLRSIQVVIPPEKLLMEYNYRVEPLFTLLRSNEAENKSLTALRDSLLPKLMSGEIDVSGIQL